MDIRKCYLVPPAAATSKSDMTAASWYLVAAALSVCTAAMRALHRKRALDTQQQCRLTCCAVVNRVCLCGWAPCFLLPARIF